MQLKNIYDAPLMLEDFYGIIIEIGQSVDVSAFDRQVLCRSIHVAQAIISNRMSVVEGGMEHVSLSALTVMRGESSQYTRDGKRIITSSDRPQNHFRYFTGYDDDVVNKVIGAGKALRFNVPAGGSQALYLDFIDDIYVRDGKLYVEDTEPDSECLLTVEVVAPAGIPFPSPTKTGTLDLVEGAFVANTSGTGAYMVASVEVHLNRLLNRMFLHEGDNDISTPEPILLPSAYKLKVTVENFSTLAAIGYLTMGLYRSRTV